jgi:NAD+ synthetase
MNTKIYEKSLKFGQQEAVFNKMVEKTAEYVENNSIKSLVLGISGGIDSTLMAAVCCEVCNRLKIPFYGYSLPIKNKPDELTSSDLVGSAFCKNGYYKEVAQYDFYKSYLENLYNYEYCSTEKDTMVDLSSKSVKEIEELMPEQAKIANGNIMARLRMMFLYNQAWVKKGIVIDTDNLTEHYLGFWTIHGDEGDFNPMGGLWKSEVYSIAKWLHAKYYSEAYFDNEIINKNSYDKMIALEKSIKLIPTDGNGISNSDLEQIGGKDYYEVDKILIPIVCKGADVLSDLLKTYPSEVVMGIWNRYKSSEFKRRTSRVIKVSREELLKGL